MISSIKPRTRLWILLNAAILGFFAVSASIIYATSKNFDFFVSELWKFIFLKVSNVTIWVGVGCLGLFVLIKDLEIREKLLFVALTLLCYQLLAQHPLEAVSEDDLHKRITFAIVGLFMHLTLSGMYCTIMDEVREKCNEEKKKDE